MPFAMAPENFGCGNMNVKNFAVIGVGGFIAPRHLQAIKDTGNRIIAAVDRTDSVGLLDKYSFEIDFFTEFERFDRHIEKLKYHGDNKKIDYVSICSPNYLHDAHIRFALLVDADAICEKPIVLNPWNLDLLEELELRSGKKIYNVLQLRLHKKIQELKEKFSSVDILRKVKIELTYITSRGKWYDYSWKSDISKSGGVVTNIGIHFFDMLQWIFGKTIKNELHFADNHRAGGFLELKNAEIKWFLSIDRNDLSMDVRNSGKTTFRSLTIDKEEFEFSEGFTDLHTEIYREILQGNGFRIGEARDSIQIAYNIRNAKPIGIQDYSNEFLKGIQI